jgi:hypothetical protein
MVKTEPPTLQILICLVMVVPARTLPKCIAKGELLSQPPSDVDTAIDAMGGLPAEPVSKTSATPPSDQRVRVIEYVPGLDVLKKRATPRAWPGAKVVPTAGKAGDENPKPNMAFPPLEVTLVYGALESLPACQAKPFRVMVLLPMFWMLTAPFRPF